MSQRNFRGANGEETVRGEMRYRPLGRTGEEVSVIGLGGHHIGRQKEEKESIRIIRAAIDAGITFMDNCWDYHDGGSEVRMGKALRDGYRKRVFLMTKIDGRTRKAAAEQIDQCLRRLQTDVIDLLQHHEVIRLEDPDRIFAEGGAQEAVLAAKKAGKVRFIGFTGHKDPLVHLRMLEVAKEHGFRFDAVQMPLNVMDAHFRSFERHVLPVLVKEGIGVLGMKAMGDGLVLTSKTVTPVECLHYAMSLPISDRHHRDRQHGDPHTGPGGGQDVPEAHEKTDGRASRSDGSGGLPGQVRGVQDDERLRRNGQEPGLAGGSGQEARLRGGCPYVTLPRSRPPRTRPSDPRYPPAARRGRLPWRGR